MFVGRDIFIRSRTNLTRDEIPSTLGGQEASRFQILDFRLNLELEI